MDIFTRKPCLTSNLILYQNLNSSCSHLTLSSHFLTASSFSVRGIKLAVVFDYLPHTYTTIHHNVSPVPLGGLSHPILSRPTTTVTMTIIKTITVNVEAHYTVLGNMPTVHILTAKALRSFVFPNNFDEKCYLLVSLKICGSTKIIIFLDRNS